MIRRYIVTKYVRERYEVEIESDLPPTDKRVLDAAVDPYEVKLIRSKIQEAPKCQG